MPFISQNNKSDPPEDKPERENAQREPIRVKPDSLEFAIIEELRPGEKDSVTLRHGAGARLGKLDIDVGSFYVTIDRLEGEGIISRREGEIVPERGNTPRIYFSLVGATRRFVVEDPKSSPFGLPDLGGLQPS
jgi:hypothetical protein